MIKDEEGEQMKLLIELYIKGLLTISIIELTIICLYLLIVFINGHLKRRSFQKLVIELILIFLSTVPILSFAYIAVVMMMKARNLS